MTRLLYRCLLSLHPRKFRDKYAGEMLWIFDQATERSQAARLLIDGALSLIRQRALRSVADDQTPHSHSDRSPAFHTLSWSGPAKRPLAYGALCSLLTFVLMAAVVSRGDGRFGTAALPRAAVVRFMPLNFIAMAAPPQAASVEEPATVRGRLVDGITGNPVAGVTITGPSSGRSASAITDSAGRFQIEGVRPGSGSLSISYSPEHPYSGAKSVAAEAGGNEDIGDFTVFQNPTISGRITDENDEPMTGIEVSLLRRSYYMGEWRYHRKHAARTNDQGEYVISLMSFGQLGGGELIMWARRPEQAMPAWSDEPADPAMRRAALLPTYYPGVLQPEEATVLHIRPGDRIVDRNIQMARAPNLCIEASVEMPASPEGGGFTIQTLHPTFGLDSAGGIASMPSNGRLKEERDLRICGLSRGDYRLTIFTGDVNQPDGLGSMLFSLTDHDVKKLRVAALPRLALPVKSVWAAEPPQEPTTAPVSVRLQAMHRSIGGIAGSGSAPPLQDFEITFGRSGGPRLDPVIDEYAATVARLPEGVYVKDLLYGGSSVLHRPLLLGSELPGSELRVVLAHDGGTVRATVSDVDGKPLGDATVLLIPKAAATHERLAETRIAGFTDQRGQFRSAAVAPGEYIALAMEGDFRDTSPETLAALFNARSQGREVRIAPNQTLELQLEARKPIR